MKRFLLAGLLATTAFSAFAADQAPEKKGKKADCPACCKECGAKSCPPSAPKK